jgi:imidazolonepropionase-like amidohydrolase
MTTSFRSVTPLVAAGRPEGDPLGVKGGKARPGGNGSRLPRSFRGSALLVPFLALLGCGGDGGQGAGVVAFTEIRLLDGTGGLPQEPAVLLIRDGRILGAGPAGEVAIPAGAELRPLPGRTVIPGLINGHGHVGVIPGVASAAEYTREALEEQLRRYARYGITTVVSLGGDGPAGVTLRDDQVAGRGGAGMARLFVAGPVLDPQTVEEVPPLLDSLAAMGVDWAKIRVDDALGQRPPMSPEIYGAVIREAHARGIPLAAHMVRLEDAKGLLDAGADLLAHSVRDAPVDAALVEQLRSTGVCLSPTITREISTFVFAERPEFFDDPFFREHSDLEMARTLETPEQQAQFRNSAGGAYWRAQLPLAEENMRVLSEAGIPLAFGTDSGPFGRFQGFFEHVEMERMTRAGLTPEQVLLSATRDAAHCLRLSELGTLEAGKRADFVVLRADPLTDIRNAREIESVWVGGAEVEGAGAPPGG